MSKILQDISIGKNLQRLRKERQLTQSDVCTRMSLAGRPMLQSTYAQIETGRRNIYVSDLIALRAVLDVSYDDIFAGLEPVNKYEQGYE